MSFVTRVVPFRARSGATTWAEQTFPQTVSRGAILILPDGWGLSSPLRIVIEYLARADYTVFAPDLFRGQTACDPGEAAILTNSLHWPRAVDEALGAAGHLLAAPETLGRLGVLGFGIGGALALAVASRVQGTSAVAAYGGLLEPRRVQSEAISAPTLQHLEVRESWPAAIARGEAEPEVHSSWIQTLDFLFQCLGSAA